MRAGTQQALRSINRAFYAERAEEFARTRSAPWPGWARVVDRWLEVRDARQRPNVLDLGCGNGRFWPYLLSRVPNAPGVIVGLDLSLALLHRAERQTDLLRDKTLRACADCFGDSDLPVRAGEFDLVAVFGAMHHIPSGEHRLRVLRQALHCVRTGGVLAATFWRQVVLSRKRRIAWSEYSRWRGAAIDESDLEPGDALLGWGPTEEEAAPESVRYCHLFADAEVDALGDDLARRRWREAFNADGPSGEDNRYLLIRRGG